MDTPSKGNFAHNKPRNVNTMATANKNKKSSKSTKAAKAAAPAKEEGTPIKPAKEKKPAAEKLPWLKREAVKWTRLFTRAKTLSGRMTTAQVKKHSPDLVDAIEAASEAMAHLDSVINALSDGDDKYAPGGIAGAGKVKAEIGSIVCFTDKGRAKYEDLLDEEEMVDLEVLKVKGSMLTVRAKATDEKFKVPRGQVRVQDTDEE